MELVREFPAHMRKALPPSLRDETSAILGRIDMDTFIMDIFIHQKAASNRRHSNRSLRLLMACTHRQVEDNLQMHERQWR